MPASVAFIGLGNMGAPMAHHLLDAGHALHVFARRAETMQAFVTRGARACASPADAAREAEFVFINVTATSDVEQVLLGPGGVAETARPGTAVIDHSTISPAATRQIAASLAERGIAFLDAPVSGGVKGAQEATLSIMVGGHADHFAQALPLLQILGRVITHVGGHGAGQVAKACNQIVQVINIQGIAEAMLFAQRHGVDTAAILRAISAGMAGSKMLDLMGPKMASRDFTPGIEARLHEKDFAMVREVAEAAGLSLPAIELVSGQLRTLVDEGWGRDDTSSLLRVLEIKQKD